MADFMREGRTKHCMGLYAELRRLFSDATERHADLVSKRKSHGPLGDAGRDADISEKPHPQIGWAQELSTARVFGHIRHISFRKVAVGPLDLDPSGAEDFSCLAFSSYECFVRKLGVVVNPNTDTE
jgi:hypothetical protein